MYGLTVIEVMTMSGHLSNIDEIRNPLLKGKLKTYLTHNFLNQVFSV